MAVGAAAHEDGPVDVGDEGGGERPEGRIDRGEHDGREHHTAQQFGHDRADEEGEDLIRTRQRLSWMLGVEREEPGPDGEIEEQRHQRPDGREGEGALALPARLHGEETLHQVVVGPEGGHGADEAVEHGEPEDVGVGEHAPPEIGRARRGSPVDDGEPSGLGGGAEHGPQSAVDAEGEKTDGERAADEKGARLKDVGPHHGLDPAQADVRNGDDREEGDGRPERPADEHGHGQRGGHESHPRAQEPRDEEEDRARHLARGTEAVAQELVDGGAVVAVEGGDEEIGDGELGQARAHEELRVFPVLAVGGGGDRDDGDGADLRGEKGQTGRPPRDAPTREEEVRGAALLAAEGAPDGDEGEERSEKDRVVGPGQRGRHEPGPLWLRLMASSSQLVRGARSRPFRGAS